MHIIGLIGGVASGKSAVAAELEKLGAVVLDADAAAHELIDDPQVQQLLIDRWGRDILRESGEIDRSAIAARVFAPGPEAAGELEFLEQTLHPRIRRAFEQRLDELAAAAVRAVVIDAPLLLEAGWQVLCDSIVFVAAQRAKRLQRSTLRNWTESEFAQREHAQMPIETKRELATHVLDNNGSRESLRGQIVEFWNSLSPSG